MQYYVKFSKIHLALIEYDQESSILITTAAFSQYNAAVIHFYFPDRSIVACLCSSLFAFRARKSAMHRSMDYFFAVQ